MNLQKYTEKAQEAVLTARQMAEEANHNQIELLHLLRALVEQPEGVVPQVLARLGERHITLEVTPEALDLLGNEGFDPVYGARPLKRVIQRRILDRLALENIEGTIKDGDTALVEVRGGEMSISKK